jgi:hypothetical protein
VLDRTRPYRRFVHRGRCLVPGPGSQLIGGRMASKLKNPRILTAMQRAAAVSAKGGE